MDSLKKMTKKGRKSKYQDTDVELIKNLLAEGYSLTKFCAIREIDRSTLYEWCKMYPEFGYAVDVAKCRNLAFWEDIRRKVILEGDPKEMTAIISSTEKVMNQQHPELNKTQDNSATEINIQTLNMLPNLTQAELEAKIINQLKRVNLAPKELPNDSE